MRKIYLKPRRLRAGNPIVHFIIRDKRRNCYLGTLHAIVFKKNNKYRGIENDYDCRGTSLISEELYQSLLAESKSNHKNYKVAS